MYVGYLSKGGLKWNDNNLVTMRTVNTEGTLTRVLRGIRTKLTPYTLSNRLASSDPGLDVTRIT